MTLFNTLPLSKPMQESIAALGFTEASPIQAEAIPLLLEGHDLIGQAQTGTGKTAAFAIPTIERLIPHKKQLQTLIICPTRELALQVTESYKLLMKHNPQLSVVSIYGGEPINRQIRALLRRPQVIVGTPGRLLDHVRRGTIRLNTIQTVVLDEADEMLDMGFREDIETLLNATATQPGMTRQTVLFSATMSPAILALTRQYQTNPQHVKVAPKPQEEAQIDQRYVEVHPRKKWQALNYLLDSEQCQLSIVFCNTQRQVDDLVDQMRADGYAADGLHGGMNQSKRDRVMNGFRRGTVQHLVATDVAARGIDVKNIDAVFNYDFPKDIEYYIHRIGRTGRAGQTGKAFTFLDRKELRVLNRLRQTTRKPITKHDMPEQISGQPQAQFPSNSQPQQGFMDRNEMDHRSMDRNPMDRKPIDRKPTDRKPMDRKPGDRKPMDRRNGDNKAWSRKGSSFPSSSQRRPKPKAATVGAV